MAHYQLTGYSLRKLLYMVAMTSIIATFVPVQIYEMLMMHSQVSNVFVHVFISASKTQKQNIWEE